MFRADSGFLKKYILIIAAVILPLMVLSFLWFSYNKQKQVYDSLHAAARLLRESDGLGDYRMLAEEFWGVRITVMDESGAVLADNQADINTMGSHAERPEFERARRGEYGADMRKSKATGKKTIYVMTKLKNGTYVRLAQSTSLTYDFLIWLFAPVVFLGLCLAVLMLAFAKNRQIEKMRQEFVANVSHELKTPLTSIKGFAELTSAGLVSDVEAVKNYQKIIVAQSDRLLATITDILQLSKMENTKPKDPVRISTRTMAEQVREALKPIADEKNIIIQILGGGEIAAEPEPIYQMLYNLVDNGIKYGKKGGFVKIILHEKKITVTDNGIGIPPDSVERVFERFYRVDKSRSAKSGGTGLGLAIVKHTVQKYNGSVSIKSEEGGGTRFFVEF